PGPQRRTRLRLHDLLAHRRRREVRAQEQDALQDQRLSSAAARDGDRVIARSGAAEGMKGLPDVGAFVFPARSARSLRSHAIRGIAIDTLSRDNSPYLC